MKKIVALVLALIMALSLATVAFAADESYFAASVDSPVKLDGVTLKEIKAAGEKNVAVYAPVVTVNGYEIPMALSLAKATKADYDFVFVSGKDITYLKNTVGGVYTGEAKPVKTSSACGGISAKGGAVLYELDGKILKAGESFNLRTVAQDAIEDYATEWIGDFFGFTKADWEDAAKDFQGAMTVASVTDLVEHPVEFMVDAFEAVKKAAEKNYSNGKLVNDDSWIYYGEDGEFIGVDGIVRDLCEQLIHVLFWQNKKTGTLGKFHNVADWWDAQICKKPGAEGPNSYIEALLADAREEIESTIKTKIKTELGIKTETNIFKEGGTPLKTDAKFYGGDMNLNISRAILKQATSVRAIALVDGKLITLYDAVEGTDYVIKTHTYEVDYATVNGKTALTKVYCTKCKTTFDFVVGDETAATEKFGAGNFENITNEMKDTFTTKFLGKHDVTFNWDTMKFKAAWKSGTGYTWNMFDDASRNIKAALAGGQLYVGTAAAEAAETEVESAKTFDVGVALYAGMAIMSVAGSAVVIGKKKF